MGQQGSEPLNLPKYRNRLMRGHRRFAVTAPRLVKWCQRTGYYCFFLNHENLFRQTATKTNSTGHRSLNKELNCTQPSDCRRLQKVFNRSVIEEISHVRSSNGRLQRITNINSTPNHSVLHHWRKCLRYTVGLLKLNTENYKN